jgi:hypothetical protein
MYYRHWAAGCELSDAANVAGRDEIRMRGCNVGQLAIAEGRSNVRLKYVVGPSRAAAEMPFRDLERLEARCCK